MAITFYPKQNELARAREAGSIAGLASSRPWIVADLDLGVPVSGLDATITDGRAWIAGFVVDVASEDVTVPDAATTTVYLGLVRDVNDNVTSATLATSAHASGEYVVLGTVTAAGGDITGVATTGRSPETQVDGDAVTSVFTRTGAVVATAGDYDADQVDYDNAASGLAATDVQEAIDELAARPSAGGWDGINVLSSDVTFSSETYDDIITVAVEANKTYLIEIDGYVIGTTSGKTRIQIPSGASISGHFIGFSASENISFQNTQSRGDLDANLTSGVAVITNNINVPAFIRIIAILTVSTTSGNIIWDGARNTGSDSFTFKLGSNLKIKDIT